MRADCTVAAALTIASFGVCGPLAPDGAAPPAVPRLAQHIVVAPRSARIFAGASLQFRVSSTGPALRSGVVWALIGPGTVDVAGTYRAPSADDGSALIVASAGGSAAAAAVDVVPPPSPASPLAIVSCYDGGAIDVRGADALDSIGLASTGAAAAGIAANAARRIAVVASGERVAIFDPKRAALTFSAPVTGARFSEVAWLRRDLAVATDNNSLRGGIGVRTFRVGDDLVPVLASSAAAGDTPEGIAVDPGGAGFFVTNVNGNTVTRYVVDRAGTVRAAGSAATGHRPFGVAVDDVHRLLFVADNDTPTVSGSASKPGLEVFALPSLRRIARLTTGTPHALPLGVAVDPAQNRLFVTNEGDATVVAYSVAPLRRLTVLRTGRTPWLPAVDTARKRLYVPDAMADAFSVYDERSLRPVALERATCGYPTSIAPLS